MALKYRPPRLCVHHGVLAKMDAEREVGGLCVGPRQGPEEARDGLVSPLRVGRLDKNGVLVQLVAHVRRDALEDALNMADERGRVLVPTFEGCAWNDL